MNDSFDHYVDMRDTSVRAMIPLEQGGHISMSGLPGLMIGRDGSSYLDPENCNLTIEFLRRADMRALYLLMEEHELPPNAKTVITGSAKRSGIELVWLPIVDFGVPDAQAEAKWTNGREKRAKILSSGHGICLSCLYGAGRSGMMAAALCAEIGIAPKKAVRFMRKHFAEAVGSKPQEQWVSHGSYLAETQHG